jgi:hypothetical protein
MTQSAETVGLSYEAAAHIASASGEDISATLNDMAGGLGEISDSVDRTRLGMQRLGLQTGILLQRITGVPYVVSRTVSSLGSMTATLGTTAAGLTGAAGAAAGFISALSPLLPVISIAIGAGVGMFSMMRDKAGEAVQEIVETNKRLDEMTGQYQSLKSELSSQYTLLSDNNELLRQMNILGANDGFINRIEKENELLKQQIEYNNILAFVAKEEASKAAVEILTQDFASGVFDERKHYGPYEQNYKMGGTGRRYTGGGDPRGKHEYLASENRNLIDTVNALLDFHEGNPNNLTVGFEDYESKIHEYIETMIEARENLKEPMPEVDAVIARYIEIFKVPNIISQEQEFDDFIEKMKSDFDALNKMTALSDFTTPYIDLAKEVENLTTAYGALENATLALNAGQGLGLQTFYDLMNMSPQYLNMLMNEHGALQDLDYATRLLTQSKIDEMAISQARAVLDLAMTYQDENKSIKDYGVGINMASNDMWGLVESQLAYIRATEVRNMMEAGVDEYVARYEAGRNMNSLYDQISMFRNWADSVKASVTVDEIKRVGEVGTIRNTIRLKEEDMRMLAELAERDRVIQINQRPLQPAITVNVTNGEGSGVLDAQDIANSINRILIEQAASHTNGAHG